MSTLYEYIVLLLFLVATFGAAAIRHTVWPWST